MIFLQILRSGVSSTQLRWHICAPWSLGPQGAGKTWMAGGHSLAWGQTLPGGSFTHKCRAWAKITKRLDSVGTLLVCLYALITLLRYLPVGWLGYEKGSSKNKHFKRSSQKVHDFYDLAQKLLLLVTITSIYLILLLPKALWDIFQSPLEVIQNFSDTGKIINILLST